MFKRVVALSHTQRTLSNLGKAGLQIKHIEYGTIRLMKNQEKHELPQENTEQMPPDSEQVQPRLPKTPTGWLQKCEFLTSAPKFALCPADTGLEVAFAGRSNAGKSSAINAITQQRQLARSSKTPGRTQMINFFCMGDDQKRLVDLPGYGYAAVPEKMKKLWQKELEHYLVDRKSLNGLVLLMDIRHPLQFYDEQMLHWAKDGDVFVHILLTKADKYKRNPAMQQLFKVKQQLESMELNFSIQLFSALKKDGLDELRKVLAARLEQGFTDYKKAYDIKE